MSDEYSAGGFYYDGEGVEVVQDLLDARQIGAGMKRRLGTRVQMQALIILSSLVMVGVTVTGPLSTRIKAGYVILAVLAAVVCVLHRMSVWTCAFMVGAFVVAIAHNVLVAHESREQHADDDSDTDTDRSMIADDEYADHSIFFT